MELCWWFQPFLEKFVRSQHTVSHYEASSSEDSLYLCPGRATNTKKTSNPDQASTDSHTRPRTKMSWICDETHSQSLSAMDVWDHRAPSSGCTHGKRDIAEASYADVRGYRGLPANTPHCTLPSPATSYSTSIPSSAPSSPCLSIPSEMSLPASPASNQQSPPQWSDYPPTPSTASPSPSLFAGLECPPRPVLTLPDSSDYYYHLLPTPSSSPGLPPHGSVDPLLLTMTPQYFQRDLMTSPQASITMAATQRGSQVIQHSTVYSPPSLNLDVLLHPASAVYIPSNAQQFSGPSACRNKPRARQQQNTDAVKAEKLAKRREANKIRERVRYANLKQSKSDLQSYLWHEKVETKDERRLELSTLQRSSQYIRLLSAASKGEVADDATRKLLEHISRSRTERASREVTVDLLDLLEGFEQE